MNDISNETLLSNGRETEKLKRYIGKLEAKIEQIETKYGEQIIRTGHSHRQGRILGPGPAVGPWVDFHGLTLSGVAETLAAQLDRGSVTAEVRDMDAPGHIITIQVKRVAKYIAQPSLK